MLNLCLPMKVINITQHSGGSFSHPNYSLDLAGSDQGIDFAFCLGDYWRCIAGPWGNNTYFFTCCNEGGEPVEVHCADGLNRIVTIAMTHADFDNEQYVPKPEVGKIYSNGEPMYQEGTYGFATGNHIHFEVAEGLHYSKNHDGNLGVYRMENELKPEDVCFICDSFSTVTNMDGVVMKHCDTPYYNALEKLTEGLNGIDISNWQEKIDLSQVYADFVIIKASEGVDWRDPCYEKLYQMAVENKKRIGLYHYARPTKNNNPIDEADTFIKAAKSIGAIGKALLALDWEAENMWNVDYAKQWLDRVTTVTGIKPLIYMSESVVRSYDWTSVAEAGYGLWVAKYRDHDPDYNYDMSMCGAIPSIKSWSDYEMWQWTGTGRLDGYDGDLDCNIFYGSYTEWDAWATNSDPLAAYTDEELAYRVLEGIYGNAERRKEALGERYAAVQAIVNKIVEEKNKIDQEQTVQHPTGTTTQNPPQISAWPVLPQFPSIKPTEPSITPTVEEKPKEPISYSSSNVFCEEISYKGIPIYITKIGKNQEVRGSVMATKYGRPGDKASPNYFVDDNLINAKYTEVVAQNGSTFYTWNEETYAEGIEISRGKSNQELYLSAVTKFNKTMAVGFPFTGGIDFLPQYKIIENSSKYYGAATGIFGIIYQGQRNFMGAEIDRNGGFEKYACRSILAEDTSYYYSICFGQNGLCGTDLYDLCVKISSNMMNAICFDGGYSVFQRNGSKYNVNASTQVKNAIGLFIKKVEELPKEDIQQQPVIVEPVYTNPLDKYSDEELAQKVLDGEFGSGEARKNALGSRYKAVQIIVNTITLKKMINVGTKIKLHPNAKSLCWNGAFPDNYYDEIFTIKMINDDKIAFGTDKYIVGTVAISDIILV